MPSCQKLRKQDATHAADNLLRAHCWTLLNDWAHGHFVSGVARENGVLCAVITCNFPAYSIARASFRLDEKKIGNSSKSFGKDLPKRTTLDHAVRWRKTSRNRKSVVSLVINARALTCYFLTRSLHSWQPVLFNYPYLYYYLNLPREMKLGVFRSEWQPGPLN